MDWNYALTDESIDDLQIGGYYILQKSGGFRFGVDAVLLSDFIREGSGRLLDLCTGTGIVPILAYAKGKADYIEGIDILPEMADMANRSMQMNGISDRVKIKNADLCRIADEYKGGSFDSVSCNPPYIKMNAGESSVDFKRAVARHEISCTIYDVAAAASHCLRAKGSLYMIHRAYRLVDIFDALTKNRLEPKRMRMVSSSYDRAPSMVLIEAVKDGNRQLNIEPSLIV